MFSVLPGVEYFPALLDWESLELTRDLLNSFNQNADNDMDNKIQAEADLDED